MNAHEFIAIRSAFETAAFYGHEQIEVLYRTPTFGDEQLDQYVAPFKDCVRPLLIMATLADSTAHCEALVVPALVKGLHDIAPPSMKRQPGAEAEGMDQSKQLELSDGFECVVGGPVMSSSKNHAG